EAHCAVRLNPHTNLARLMRETFPPGAHQMPRPIFSLRPNISTLPECVLFHHGPPSIEKLAYGNGTSILHRPSFSFRGSTVCGNSKYLLDVQLPPSILQ